MNNVERFDVFTGLLFADLYESFPVMSGVEIDNYESELIAQNDFDSGWDFEEFADSSLKWLEACGYIFLKHKTRGSGAATTYSATLAPRVFDAMRQPSPLDKKITLGESFRNTVSEKSWQGLRVIVSTALSSSTSAVVSAGL